nr:hypothetical protein [Arthrobacter sp. KBS0702]
MGDWAETLAPSTLKVTYGYLASMFKAAVLDHVVAASPCVGINLPAVVDVAVVPLRTEKVQELADKIWKPHKPRVVFCAATGLRSSEMRGLTWDRVDFKASMISIDRQCTGAQLHGPGMGSVEDGGEPAAHPRGGADAAAAQGPATGPGWSGPDHIPILGEGDQQAHSERGVAACADESHRAGGWVA